MTNESDIPYLELKEEEKWKKFNISLLKIERQKIRRLFLRASDLPWIFSYVFLVTIITVVVFYTAPPMVQSPCVSISKIQALVSS